MTDDSNRSELGPIVSLNRFERKKNVALLIRAYAIRASKDSSTPIVPPLVVAGGYNPRNVENVQHLAELRTLAHDTLSLPTSSVSFRPSVIDSERRNRTLAFGAEVRRRQLSMARRDFWSIPKMERRDVPKRFGSVCPIQMGRGRWDGRDGNVLQVSLGWRRFVRVGRGWCWRRESGGNGGTDVGLWREVGRRCSSSF